MKRIVQKLIPASIRRRVFKLVKEYFTGILKQTSSQIPKFELEKKHIENARLIVDRAELLRILPKNGVVAELGVDEGDFSEMILSISKPKKLHLIDIWASERYNQNKRQKVENRFINQIERKEVEINLGFSTEVVNDFQDSYFDWIYVDTVHSYKTVIAELEAYRMKVKENGIIAGHDFIMGNWTEMTKYGVIEAVYEFCLKYNWEILYLTVENKHNPSFAIRRILAGIK
jgi:hypothetical protein